MVEIILAGLVGVLLGIGGTKLTDKRPTDDKTSQAQQEVIKQLTDLDIVEKLCAPTNVQTIEDRLLCRELTCLVYSRGIDSKTGESCEEIQNLANTVSLIDYCKTNMENKSDCYDIFWRRK